MKPKFIKSNNFEFKSKEKIKKYIKILKSNKEIIKINKLNEFNKDFNENFQYLANGVFQAEGHIGGYFLNKNELDFRPLVFIGLTGNTESLKFFVSLNKLFRNKLRYSIEKIPSGLFFIKLISTDWEFILNNFIPYFDKVYGDKLKGLKRLEKLYLLLSQLKNNTKYNTYSKNNIREKIILLGYNLIDNSKRKIPISKYFSLFNITPSKNIDFFKIEENKNNINNYFLLGFILGDGNIYVRIRKTNNLPWFIPSVRIGQKFTKDNIILLNNIKNTLKIEGINSNVSHIGHLYVISINQINNVEKLSKWLPDLPYFWFWKKNAYLLLKKALLLMKLKATYWQKSKEVILKLIYKISNYNKPFNYWLKIIRHFYSSKIKDLYYISLWREKAWSVKLPIKIKPKVKFFFFKTYNSKDNALIEAKKYRNQKLDQWLKENKLIK